MQGCLSGYRNGNLGGHKSDWMGHYDGSSELSQVFPVEEHKSCALEVGDGRFSVGEVRSDVVGGVDKACCGTSGSRVRK